MTNSTFFGMFIPLGAGFAAMHFFNRHTERKFDHKFFTGASHFASLILCLLIYAVYKWIPHIKSSWAAGNIKGVIGLSCAPFIFYAVMVFLNWRRTDGRTCFVGSLLQLGTLPAAAVLGVAWTVLQILLMPSRPSEPEGKSAAQESGEFSMWLHEEKRKPKDGIGY